MTFTYDTTTLIGQVRFKIQDTDISGGALTTQFADEELQMLLNETGNRFRAAAGLALVAWATLLSRCDKRVKAGSWEGDQGDIVKDMKILADEYFCLDGWSPSKNMIWLNSDIDWTPEVQSERIVKEQWSQI